MTVDIEKIMQYLPHRYPFLLVDRVLEYEEGESIRALKNVTVNEPQFTGHFPTSPVMPGVLLIEAMAQTGGILAFMSVEKSEDYLVYFTGIDNARFRQPVRPGDQVVFVMSKQQRRGHMWKFKGEAYVDDKLVCSATLMATLVPRQSS